MSRETAQSQLRRGQAVVRANRQSIRRTAIIIVVTNPLDAMAQAALKVSGFPRSRARGMAGVWTPRA